MTQVREVPVVFGCGGQRLLGIVSQPAQNRSRVGVVIVVGGPQYRVGSHRQFVLMARALAGAGLPVLRFDYRGMGDSDGETRSFEHVSEDISAAIDEFMRVVPGMDGVVLWGLCDGASAASMYCAGDRRVQGLILANPWVRTMAGEARSYLRYYYLQRLLQRSFWSKVFSGRFNPARSIGELSVTVKQAQSATAAAAPSAFIDAMRAGLQKFTGRTLFLISERDLVAKQFVDLCQQQKPWKRIMASSKVATVVLPAADHTFSAREDLDKVSRHCIEWLQALAAARTAA